MPFILVSSAQYRDYQRWLALPHDVRAGLLDIIRSFDVRRVPRRQLGQFHATFSKCQRGPVHSISHTDPPIAAVPRLTRIARRAQFDASLRAAGSGLTPPRESDAVTQSSA